MNRGERQAGILDATAKGSRTMKFDEKYPDARPGVPPDPNVVLALREEQQQPCAVCGDVTRWFHRQLIEHLCSEECVEAYLQAN